MLERNMKIKNAPEQWHAEAKQHFNMVITFEERVFEAVYEGVASRSACSLFGKQTHTRS